MKIAYVTTYDAADVRQWSGTGHFIARALQSENTTIEYVGNLKERYSLLMKGRQYLCQKLLKKDYLRARSKTITHGYARQVAEQVARSRPDVIFSPGTIPVSYLDCDVPIVIWTDATFSGMVGFYPSFSNLTRQSIIDGNAAERAALERCALAIYSSEWAARSAIEQYGADPAKVKVVPFGANLQHEPTEQEMRKRVAERPRDVCKLLFLGVDWERKGGDIVLAVAQELNRRGIRSELTLVGCAPPKTLHPLPDFVKPLGFISKATPNGTERLDRLISESHFLFIPSRADCTPIVFGEANSFGVPCLGTDVGGIRSVISDGVNGYALPPGASIDAWCDLIGGHMRDYARYTALAHASFAEYRRRLNWSVAGEQVRDLMRGLLPN